MRFISLVAFDGAPSTFLFRRFALPLAATIAIGAGSAGTVARAQTAPPQTPPVAAGPATGAGTPQAAGRATWDERYLYLAFQIDDTDIQGTEGAPLSAVEQDDSVGVYLQIGTDRPAAPNADTHAMIVSAAGGFTFLRGDTATKAFAVRRDIMNRDRQFSIKYGVVPVGTLNRSDDNDQRYTVEMAIPWDALGVKGADIKSGTEIGFNVVARERAGAGLTSLAPGVTGEADVPDPSKWSRLVLAGPDGAAPAGSNGAVIAPRVEAGDKGVAPLINGVILLTEWPSASRFAWASPTKPAAPIRTITPVAPGGQPADVVVPVVNLGAVTAGAGFEKLTMARYLISFQGDPRKAIGFRGVRSETGDFLLSEHPLNGAGPWFSADRTAWHRDQLTEMRRDGVDVALVETGGPLGSFAVADDKAVLVMVGALREMATERVPAPQVSLYLDTTRLTPGGAGKTDLSASEGRALLYDAIRRWFLLVPPELRARIQIPIQAGGAGAFPIFLSDAASFTNADNDEWVADLRARFAGEFGTQTGGATLVFIGGTGFDAAKANMSASAPLATGGMGTGPVPSFVVMPGRDQTGLPLTPRKSGDAYRESWAAAIAAKPVWTIINSWNDWTSGTEVEASRQYGARYLDLTRLYTLEATGLQPRGVRWLASETPKRMRPGQLAQGSVTLQNIGTESLRAGEGFGVAYRWIKDGKVVWQSAFRLPLAADLLPTRSVRVPVAFAAVRDGVDDKGERRLLGLEPGDYTVQVDVAQAKAGEPDKYAFLSETAATTPLSVPVTIAATLPDIAQFEGTTTPPLMQSGGVYATTVRVRWTGEQTLPADQARLTYELATLDGRKTIATGAFPLTEDLTPGREIRLPAIIALSDTGGTPLPPAYPEIASADAENGTLYRLRWILTRTQATENIAGEYIERVAVYPGDDEARVVLSKAPPVSVEAEQTVPMEVTIVNRGPSKWTVGKYVVGYHWFYGDGVEAVWRPTLAAPIGREVAPGEQIKVTVPVRAPERDGRYFLSFDVARTPDEYLSALPVTRTGDLALAPIRVVGGRLTFVDLSKLFDVDAVAPENAPGDGNLDGTGATLPAENFPPDVFGLESVGALALPTRPLAKKRLDKTPPAYPSGYYVDSSPSARMISFRYGSDDNGAKNALACAGQTIRLEQGRYTGLHIAALATGGEDRPFALTLTYKDGTKTTVTKTVGDWNRAPASTGDPVAVVARRKRVPTGDVSATCVVRHVIAPVEIGKDLVSVTLPSDPKLKVFAITLEK